MTENSFSYFSTKTELMSLREQIQEDILSFASMIDEVIFELEMTHFLIDDSTESHNVEVKANDYYQQYLNILHDK